MLVNFLLFLRKLRLSSLPERSDKYLFSFKWSLYVKIFTIMILVFMLGIVIVTFCVISNPYYGFCCAVLMICFALLALISAPVALYIGDDEMEIHGMMEEIRIKYISIKKIEPISTKDARKLLPLISTMGLFGYFGKYYDRKNRRYIKLMASQFDNFVLIECKGKRNYIVSIRDYDRVVHNISDRVNEKRQYIADMVSVLHPAPVVAEEVVIEVAE